MNIERIRAIVAPVLAESNLELDDLEIVPAGKRSVVRLIVDGDGPKGRGPLLDEIGAATRKVSDALDASDATGAAPYTLEVSSRGTSRPLTKPQHWRRNTGRLVKVRLGEEELIGRITTADEAGVELEVDGTPRRVELAEVRKAVVQVEMNRPVDPDLDDVGDDDADDDTDDFGDELAEEE